MKYKTLKPTFYDDFRCSGNSCKYDCCTGWDIHLSKNDYMRGKNAKKSPELQKIFDATYKRNKKSMTDNKYGSFKFPDSKICPFLDDAKLCSFQLECGHQVLSQTCKQFPRQSLVTSGDTRELALSIGCEEVVKTLMNLEDGIEFVDSIDEIHLSFSVSPGLSADDAKQPIAKFYWDIKTMGIAILQSQNFSLDDRMLILGLASKKIDELNKTGKWDEIPDYVDSMIAHLEDDTFTGLFSDMKLDAVAALTEITISLLQLFKAGTLNIGDTILDNLGVRFVTNEETKQQSAAIYIDIYEKSLENFAEFEKRHPSAMENIMVNQFHTKGMPFNEGNIDIWEGYIYFAYLYNILKKSAIGYMAKNPTDEDFIHVIMRLGRLFTHSKQNVDNIVKKHKTQEKDTLAHMALLIKS